MTFCSDQGPTAWIKTGFTEFDEVRPYYLGNFYNLLPPSIDPGVWAAWQLNKPNGQSGMLVCLRREGSPYSMIQMDLRGIDPQAKYDIEIRRGIEKRTVQQISGNELEHYQLTLPDKPDSALVFFSKR